MPWQWNSMPLRRFFRCFAPPRIIYNVSLIRFPPCFIVLGATQNRHWFPPLPCCLHSPPRQRHKTRCSLWENLCRAQQAACRPKTTAWRKTGMAWRKNSNASREKLRATKFKLDASEFKLGLTSEIRFAHIKNTGRNHRKSICLCKCKYSEPMIFFAVIKIPI